MTEQEIKQLLQQEYNRKNWQQFLKAIFPSSQIFTQPTQLLSKGPAEKIFHFGSIKLNDFKSLGLFEVKVSDSVNIPKNRVALRNLTAKFIDQDKISGALAIYYNSSQNDYRFSFIAKHSEFTEEGKYIKTETHPKRYTYVFGENESCTTAAKRFRILLDKGSFTDFKDVIDAFSVEKLTKEFFKEYKNHYDKFVQFLYTSEYRENVFKSAYKNLSENQLERHIREFVKLLLGRIVFLYFLQKKRWLGCSADSKEWLDGDTQFLRNLFDKTKDQSNFYSKVLVELFFNTLNRKRKNNIFDLTNSRVPYLNGGLFDNTFPEGNIIDFPIDYFDNLLSFFDSYNFTIDENSPDEHEVGIDPEMLGHIFENLLEDNKDKGSYYTPKEIVHYMCQESLIRYLKNELEEQIKNYSKDDAAKSLEDFIRNGIRSNENLKNNFIKDNARIIEEKLDNIKICDPAIGSGAYPMGLLKEIYNTKLNLDWTLDPTETKLNIIKNSIYGVDIDPGAVDIARLRFWLALVVDEETPRPLPNFDYKIMQGDSLRESFKRIDFSFNFERFTNNIEVEKEKNLFGEVKEPQYSFDDLLLAKAKSKKFNIVEKETELFSTYDNEKKRQIRKEIADVEKEYLNLRVNEEQEKSRADLLLLQKELKNKTHQSKINSIERKIIKLESRLTELKSIAQELKNIELDNKQYFLWHLYFMDVFRQGGFDIIIANPPYIRADSKSPNYMDFRRDLEHSNKYKTLYEKWDIFVPFMELGLKLLKQNGVLTFITSNAIATSKYATKLLEFLQEENTTFLLDYFGKMEVFEGVGVIPLISGIVKGKSNNISVTKTIRQENFYNITKRKTIHISDFRKGGINSFRKEFTPIEIEIPNEILGDICYLSYGLRPNADERHWKGEFGKNDVLTDVKDDLHPFGYVEGKGIERYKLNNSKFIEWNTDRSPTKFARKTFPELYDRPKLLIGVMTGSIYDETNLICNHSIISCIKFCNLNSVDNRSIKNSISKFNAHQRHYLEEISEQFEYKYLLAIINSKFAYHFLNNIRRHRLENYFYPDDFRKLPIAKISLEEQKPFKILVDYLMLLRNIETPPAEFQLMDSFFDQLIDGIVYEIYFKEKIQKADREIIKHLGKLKPITKEMTYEEKLKIIKSEFERLYDKNHPVRNNLFYMDTIEEVRIIEGKNEN